MADTLSKIESLISKRQKGAYLCFDQEEIELAIGREGVQIGDEIEMVQALSFQGPTLLKSYHLPYTALNGNGSDRKWAFSLFSRLSLFKEPWHEPLAPSLLSNLHKKIGSRFLNFLRSQPLLLVGEIPLETRRLLFGTRCEQISEEECLQHIPKDYRVVLLATGWRGKILAKELIEEGENVFIIDLNGLRDALCNWELKTWESWLKKERPIKILYTSALIPFMFEERKREYIHSLNVLDTYGWLDQTYIVEAGGFTPDSFFESYSDHILYANINDPSLINKGVNEAKSMMRALDYFPFDDEDMIVKLTGRYFFHSDDFLKTIEMHPEVDAFATYWGDRGIVSTGCFAMRCKLLKKMLKEFDFSLMEDRLISFEEATTQFLYKLSKVEFLKEVGITVNVANKGIIEYQ